MVPDTRRPEGQDEYGARPAALGPDARHDDVRRPRGSISLVVARLLQLTPEIQTPLLPRSDLVSLMQLPPIDAPEPVFKSLLPYTVPSTFGEDAPRPTSTREFRRGAKGSQRKGATGLNAGLVYV